ncbi:coiled-coil domain-containing protein 91 [Elgaria multicarinata webbii]|uniref:coiled-coil domain-containing protein 91 n=1 Tax=Elgaria multicarinata webbii TaxID=159646 RepID=UPI002FCCD7A4
MDDDDFGGFEAAETFKDGNGEPQTTSPAIPWAAFPTVSEIHVPQTVSAEVLQEHSATSSSDDVLTDGQPSTSPLNLAYLKEQAPLSIDPLEVPVSSLCLTEDSETVIDDGGGDDDDDDDDDDDEKLGLNESKKHLQQTFSSLEIKLKAADEEKRRIKKELEDLLEKYRILEIDFLKEKDEKLISHQDRYNKLEEKHKLELEDLRRAGHDALAIIVEEFKALLQSVVQQREEAIEKQYASAIEKQAHKCEEMLVAQHQRLLDMLDNERKVLEEKTEESLLQQSQVYKEMLEKCMEQERESSREALAAAAKIEKQDMQAAIITAIKAERGNMKKLHEAEKELWQAEQNKEHEKIAQAIEDAMQEQRQSSQLIVKAAIGEEQQKSEKAVEAAVKQTREELLEYIKEQKRLDQVIRQRSLSSLELFLSCAQKQLNSLLHEEPTTTDAEEKKLSL